MKDERKPVIQSEPLHPSSFIPHPSLWRTFCAIEIPASACSRLTDHINELRRQFPNVRASWTVATSFISRLKSWERSKERVESLSNAAARATVSLAPSN